MPFAGEKWPPLRLAVTTPRKGHIFDINHVTSKPIRHPSITSANSFEPDFNPA